MLTSFETLLFGVCLSQNIGQSMQNFRLSGALSYALSWEDFRNWRETIVVLHIWVYNLFIKWKYSTLLSSFIENNVCFRLRQYFFFTAFFLPVGGQNRLKGKTFCSCGLEKEQGEIFMTKFLIKKEAFRSARLISDSMLKRHIIFWEKRSSKIQKVKFQYFHIFKNKYLGFSFN